VVLSTCGLFLLQAAPFLMAATVIIYAGAIVVTFLFVIMLAQQHGPSDADQRSREPFLACLGGFVLLAALLCLLRQTYDVSGRERHFQELLERAGQASQSDSVEGIEKVVGDPTEYFKELRREVEPEKGPARPTDKAREQEFIVAADLAEQDWNREQDKRSDPQAWLKTVKERFGAVYATGLRVFPPAGTVPMDEALPVSKYSGVRPNDPKPPLDRQGRVKMPAQNVAALGQSLFSDYLVAVELAGFLLLVATIGAIAIAARRTEGLR
jgi:NADH-quinone oxidoreductase subunit J